MKINILLSYLLFAFCSISIVSCEVFDPSDEIPSYVKIDSIQVIAKTGEGSSSSKIKDAWVYIDNNLQGIYELPCSFPVLASGKHTIDIKAGVFANGASSVRVPYPFYSIYSESIDLIPAQKVTAGNNGIVNVGYIPQAVFALNEDFELNGFNFTPTPGNQANMTVTSLPTEVFEGKKSAKVTLDAANGILDVITSKMNIPIGNDPIYIELNYKIENAVDLYIRFENGGNLRELGIGGIYPSYSWGKIYFEISEMLSKYPYAENFQLILHAKKSETITKAYLYFDNIKLIHFK